MEITVIIDKEDQTEEELTAKKLGYSEVYKATEFELPDGRRFFVDEAYLQECFANRIPPSIPERVITQREEMLQKLAWAQSVINKQAIERSTGLVLPNDFKP